MTKSNVREYYKRIAPVYFRHGFPNLSQVKNKTLKKILKSEMKKRRILQIQHKFKNKRIRNLKKKSLSQLEKLLRNSPHTSRTKKLRFYKKRKTRKLSKN